MVCVIDNSGSVELKPNPCLFVNAKSDGQPINKKIEKIDSDSRVLRTTGRPAVFTINPEDLVRLQMSSVAEVESVFMEPAPRRTGFHVFTIVNERNPDVRTKIYRCEQAIMDAYKNLEFDFRIIARRNRDLKDVITDLGAPVFTRR